MKTPPALAALLAALVASGCAGMSAGFAKAGYAEAEMPADVAAAPVARTARGAEPPAPQPLATEEAPAPGADASTQPGRPSQPAERLRVYSGYLELVVNEVERTRQRVMDAAVQLGGYVESTTSEYVVVRVPAERLEEAMGIVAGLGEVRARSIETTDVTEAYSDLGRRIEIAKRTRDRLYTLLDRTTDVDERVSILREIRRLTEDIERMGSALTLMEGQIRLSRLTVRLDPRIEQGGEPGRRIPFPWIAGLRPLQPSGGKARGPVLVTLPPEYAVFETGSRVRAEAADGTRISVGAVGNQPRGDSAFWRDALRYHLRDLYRSGEDFTAGSFEGEVFESKDIVPFHYLVAVAVRGEEILLAEAFFPDAATRERELGVLRTVLEGWKP